MGSEMCIRDRFVFFIDHATRPRSLVVVFVSAAAFVRGISSSACSVAGCGVCRVWFDAVCLPDCQRHSTTTIEIPPEDLNIGRVEAYQ